MPRITVDDQQLRVELTDLPSRYERPMVRAMNRALASGRGLMATSIAVDTGLKESDIREAMPLREASLARPVASFGASLKRIPLIKFGARGPEPSRGRGRGVSYRNPESGRTRIENAFIATLKSGHRGVFKRIGQSVRKSVGAWGKNLPIVELHGPSLGKSFAKFRTRGVERVQERFEKEFDHEVNFELSRSKR